MNPQQFNQIFGATAEAARKQAEEINKATKNLKDMNTSVKDAEKRFKEAQSKTSGLGKLQADFSAFAGKLAPVAAIAFAMKTAFDQVSKSAKIMGDANLDAAQKTRLLSESLPIIGSFVKSLNDFKDAVTGVTARLSQIQRGVEVSRGQRSATFEYEGAVQGVNFQRTDLEGKRRGQRGAGLVNQKFGDTSTAAGQRAYEAQLAQQPGLLARRQAEADIAAARYKANELDKLEAKQQALADRARRESMAAQAQNVQAGQPAAPKPWWQRGLGGAARGAVQGIPFIGPAAAVGIAAAAGTGEDKVGRAAGAAAMEKAAAQQIQVQNQLLAIQEQKKQNLAALAKAESDARKATISLDKARVGVLDQQLGLIKSQATSFGSLTAAERQAVLEASRQAKTQGYGSLSEDQKGLLSRGGFSEWLQDQQAKSGLASPLLAEANRNLGVDRGNFGDVQKERNAAQARILQAVQVDEQQFAEEMADKMEEVFVKIIAALGVRLEAKFRAIEAQIQVANFGR